MRLPRGHAIHPVQVSLGKTEMSQRLPQAVAGQPGADAAMAKVREQELFERVGRLRMELEGLKKGGRVQAWRRVAAGSNPTRPLGS